MIRGGVLGKITEAHAWTGEVYWPQGPAPTTGDTIPEGLDWGLWCGSSEPTPYVEDLYHPFNWRGRRRYGSGMLGDMGCHIMDPIVWSLGLGPPRTITSLGPGSEVPESFAQWATVRYTFDATPHTHADPLPVTWYHGGKLPALELARMPEGRSLPGSGSMYIGEKGVAVIPHTPSIPRLYPEADFADYSQSTLRDLYKGIEPLDHYRVWTDAITSGGRANSEFSTAGPLAETVQLGVLAARFPQRTLVWDADRLRFTGAPDADAFLRREYRKGWEVGALS